MSTVSKVETLSGLTGDHKAIHRKEFYIAKIKKPAADDISIKGGQN